jgi:hypothetical protein
MRKKWLASVLPGGRQRLMLCTDIASGTSSMSAVRCVIGSTWYGCSHSGKLSAANAL